ncbi:MAG: hypothetical protein Q9214_000921 [Letrouitia sp. 1 TL-2023]
MLQAHARKSLPPQYVAAGSWCEIVDMVACDDSGTNFATTAILTNSCSTIFSQATFILPADAPQQPLARYFAYFDSDTEFYNIYLRPANGRSSNTRLADFGLPACSESLESSLDSQMLEDPTLNTAIEDETEQLLLPCSFDWADEVEEAELQKCRELGKDIPSTSPEPTADDPLKTQHIPCPSTPTPLSHSQRYINFNNSIYESGDNLDERPVASKRHLVEADRSVDWFFACEDSQRPFDPRTLRTELLSYTRKKEPGGEKPCHHLNFLREEVAYPSATPSAVSAWAMTVGQCMLPKDPFSREGVLTAQATRLVDPVSFDGSCEIGADLHGSQLRDAFTGRVAKVNCDIGCWSSEAPSEDVEPTWLLPTDELFTYHMCNVSHENMQQVHRIHAFADLADYTPNFKGPTFFQDSFRRRNVEGEVIRCGGGEPEPIPVLSKLSIVHNVDEDDSDDNSGVVHEETCGSIEESKLNRICRTLPSITEEVEIDDTENDTIQEGAVEALIPGVASSPGAGSENDVTIEQALIPSVPASQDADSMIPASDDIDHENCRLLNESVRLLYDGARLIGEGAYTLNEATRLSDRRARRFSAADRPSCGGRVRDFILYDQEHENSAPSSPAISSCSTSLGCGTVATSPMDACSRDELEYSHRQPPVRIETWEMQKPLVEGREPDGEGSQYASVYAFGVITLGIVGAILF